MHGRKDQKPRMSSWRVAMKLEAGGAVAAEKETQPRTFQILE